MKSLKQISSSELWNDFVTERLKKLNELEIELYNAEEEILDNYFETLDEKIPEDLQKKVQDAHYEVQSAQRSFEYIQMLDKHLDKLNAKSKTIKQDLKFYQELKTQVF